ncbi:hypothetical protein SKTS_19230 [Sulfurimicrobium lacus]|uniref:HTH cro/C1-type domain-containing protein n=1 Tax=Sulfurimicrobium lacus TaxID=2715678 RepID=A0A6F8VD58_9PROT|nr:S24 family peptidase [Sulfurimicrobium lacus]BCB27037.1 hypothetical protein SKTS_19230 [Sulfurimicrobium lacus]
MNVGNAIRQLREERAMTQAELAEKIGTDKGNVSRMEQKGQGTIEKVAEVATALGVRVSDIFVQAEGRANRVPVPRDAIDIPLLNASASMGVGEVRPSDDVVVDTLRLKKHWIAENIKPITTPGNLRFIHALGDSMTPTLLSGDILLVDTGVREIAVDGIYVLEAHERLFIKRVRQRLDGAYEITSDNPTVKTVDILNGDHEVGILGRAVWVWNGRRL